MGTSSSKITLNHLNRLGVVYVRQSTARQVQFNSESTMRQYALRDKLLQLGWPPQRIEIIDEDLGVSGKFSENRTGFQKLVAQVANGEVGAIAVIEASRLSRNNADWGRITQYCGMTDTLILDEETIYDPNDVNDRLILGVKGTISEMELHNIRLRMQGGLVNKAKRGELRVPLPIGYAYDPLNRIIFDPNKDVQEAVRKVFSTFEAKGSVYETVRYFDEHKILFPYLHRNGEQKGELEWKKLSENRVLDILKHPVYTGRYVFGRSKTITTPLKRSVTDRKQEEWIADIPNHHPAYITEEAYQRNLATLEKNAHSHETDRESVPGRGNALLQGIVYCGNCGKKMCTCYQKSCAKGQNKMFPIYICDKEDPGQSACMRVNGTAVDAKVSVLIEKRLTPEAVRDAIEVKKEVENRWVENEKILELRVQKAEYEASLMRKRYLACDPDNALVRLEVEKAYNDSLSACEEAQKALDEERNRHTAETASEIEGRLANLVTDFSSVWNDPDVDIKIKKQLIRTVIQNVTLYREKQGKECRVQVLYTGGETDEFTVRCTFYGPRGISPKVREFLAEYGTEYLPSELAEKLNQQGLLRSTGKEWTGNSVSCYMNNSGIKTRSQFYSEKGYLTAEEMAKAAGVSQQSVFQRYRRGMYDGLYVRVSDRRLLFHPDALKIKPQRSAKPRS